MAPLVIVYTEEERGLARLRFADIVEHIQLLAADADTQNASLHPDRRRGARMIS